MLISLVSFKLPRLVVRVLLPLVLLIAITSLIVVHSGEDVRENLSDFLKQLDAAKHFSLKVPYVLEKGNVKFTFLNLKGKKGSPEDILKQNNARYKEVMAQEIKEPKDFDIESIRPPTDLDSYQHANATIISLVRNNEAAKIGSAIKSFESKFNSKFKYPYMFLNDEPFTERFKERIKKYTDAPMTFVQVPAEVWKKPDFVDEARENEAMDRLEKLNVAYAKKASYHHMCRFYSGKFYNLPELQKYKYYWRLEPSVKFFTDVNYDVFKYLEGTGKIYGFTINLYDIDESIETLFPETLAFLNQDDNYKYVSENGAFQWITENQQNPKKARVANGYSTCHFWSNFEIADMDFYRGEAYTNWFNYLDSTGKFFYERWGDSPVHSLGLALFADRRKIHWFRDIGYHHTPYVHCPNTPTTRGCTVGEFSDHNSDYDQNCMATWIDYEAGDLSSVY